jgi:U3 small nucleolar RNA-associated protein 21
VTSLSLSPTRDFLATTHVADVGIYTWANKTQYSQARPFAAA